MRSAIALGSVDGKELDLTLNALVPHPEFADDGEEGYQWRLRTWGTKWDLDSVECYDFYPEALEYQFATAWDPPRPWLRRVAKMFPMLEFHLYYAEPGLGFAGQYSCSGGRISSRYHTTSQTKYNCFVHDYFAGDPGLLLGDDGDWDDEEEWEDAGGD